MTPALRHPSSRPSYWTDGDDLYCRHGIILYGRRCLTCDRAADLTAAQATITKQSEIDDDDHEEKLSAGRACSDQLPGACVGRGDSGPLASLGLMLEISAARVASVNAAMPAAAADLARKIKLIRDHQERRREYREALSAATGDSPDIIARRLSL